MISEAQVKRRLNNFRKKVLARFTLNASVPSNLAIAILLVASVLAFGLGQGSGYSTGYDEGRDSGYADGYDYGYDVGYKEGEEAGYDEGRGDGYQSGYKEGRSEGYNSGYSQGYKCGSATGWAAVLDRDCSRLIWP
jgi:hypothetical protein